MFGGGSRYESRTFTEGLRAAPESSFQRRMGEKKYKPQKAENKTCGYIEACKSRLGARGKRLCLVSLSKGG